jgi:hypothetical protein
MRDAFALGGGPYHFFTGARAAPTRQASPRPASSASHSHPRVASNAWPQRRPSRRTSPSNYIASLPRRRACAQGRPSSHPASCSFSTPTICSSVNRARFICPSFRRPDSKSSQRKIAGVVRLGPVPTRAHGVWKWAVIADWRYPPKYVFPRLVEAALRCTLRIVLLAAN